MKLGIQLYDVTWPGGPEAIGRTLSEIGQAADALGFDRIGVADHLWSHPYVGGPERPVLESYTALTFLAAQTQRVSLLALVTPPTFRHPALLAKMVTTLDVLSGGRAWLGLGAGDYPGEAEGLGFPFPALAERYDLLEETVQICLRMWAGPQGDERPFDGAHYQVPRPLNLPQSLTRPHPPILIAGTGEQKTLRLVARYADACNLRPGPEISHKLEVLRRHCVAEGRDYDAIEKTCMFNFDVGPDGNRVGELIAYLRDLAAVGVETVIGLVPNVEQLQPLEILGREVIPAVAEL